MSQAPVAAGGRPRARPDALTILLNATDRELQNIGGDFTHYRDLEGLSDEGLGMRLLPDRPSRRARWLAGRVAEHACQIWEPPRLRRELLLRGRTGPVSREDLRRSGAQIVLSHIWVPVLADGCRLPTVWSTEGISPPEYYRYVNGDRWTFEDVVELYRTVSRRVSAMISFTETCARNVTLACPEMEGRMYVIHPPVTVAANADEPKPSLRDGLVRLLFVGADAERKGLTETLQAYAAVRASGAPCQLTVVSRPRPAHIEQLRGAAGARLMRTAPEVDVPALMAESDVLVIPTRADTYAKVAVEAMAHGCAVVITDMEPLPEVVPDGEVGFTVPVGDSVELARKLLVLVENPGRLRGMQAAARALHRRRNSNEAVRQKLHLMAEELLRLER